MKKETTSRPIWVAARRHPFNSLVVILLFCQSFSRVTDAFHTAPVARTHTIDRRQAGVKRFSSSELDSNDVDTVEKKKEELLRDVRFISPLLDYGYRPAVEEYENDTLVQKPLLLFLPGFDGTFLCPFLQFPELHTIFDVRCMTVGINDRSTFDQLRDGVIDFLLAELTEGKKEEQSTEASKEKPDDKAVPESRNPITKLFASRESVPAKEKLSSRPVYLIGESFGGILALEVALTLLDRKEQSPNLKGMALVNSATCYDRSKIARDGPDVAELHKLLYPAGLLKLLPLFTDQYSMDQLLLILQGEALPSVIDDEVREAYLGRVAFSLPFVLKYMPQGTLKWRLNEWLAVGCSRMGSKLVELKRHRSFQTLIVAGEQDGALPSIDEAERLVAILPGAAIHVVEGAGHASTLGSRVDLAALFRGHFKELCKNPGILQRSNKPRTTMKAVAAAGEGKWKGMEPRYDGNKVGLSPLKYWNRKYYRKFQRQESATKRITTE